MTIKNNIIQNSKVRPNTYISSSELFGVAKWKTLFFLYILYKKIWKILYWKLKFICFGTLEFAYMYHIGRYIICTP